MTGHLWSTSTRTSGQQAGIAQRLRGGSGEASLPAVPRPRGIAVLVALVLLDGCHESSRRSAPGSGAASSAAAAVPSARRPKQAPLADEQIEIRGGAFKAGSVPGSEGRHPELEPRRYEVELGPYRIDRLPYPNDPSKPPLTGVTRKQARQLCAKRGARLCTELEWERACKGPESDDYSSGKLWDPRCAQQPRSCASGFDVVAMGAALREWTASDVNPTVKGGASGAAVRGAAAAAPGPAHRCAARHAVDPDKSDEDLGFRCCKGAPNAAAVKEPKLGDVFKKTHLGVERLQKLLASDPHTAWVAKNVKFFREPDAAHTVVARGPGDTMGFNFTVLPLIWHPVPGAEYLLVTARSGKATSFVVAYYVLGKDRYKLASSFIMKDEAGPVAFAYSDSIRPRAHFSSCWGCPGETGKVLFRDPDSVVILQP